MVQRADGHRRPPRLGNCRQPRAMVTVETGISLPSTLLAYKLYGDPARAGALCDVAGSMTPALMPARFEALGK